jgi:glycine cleavage system H protein
MTDFITFSIDKFLFKIATDRLYSDEGLWVLSENGKVRIGVSDYLQQRSGDVAFVEIKPEGTRLSTGDEIAMIETIKVNISLSSPLSGVLMDINPALSANPEVINLDPYGEGWLAVVEADDWQTDMILLISPEAYYLKSKLAGENEVR